MTAVKACYFDLISLPTEVKLSIKHKCTLLNEFSGSGHVTIVFCFYLNFAFYCALTKPFLFITFLCFVFGVTGLKKASVSI